IAPLVSAAFLTYGILCCALFNYRIKGSMSIPLAVSSVKNIDFEHLAFLMTYIVPLAGLDLAQPRYTAVLTVLLLTIGAIYVKTDKFYANPTLALLGFKLYSADIVKRAGKTTRAIIITKDCLNDETCIRAIALDNCVFFAKVVK
ncbi:MAG: anti-phage protein KwaA, partial [Synergistota bacterium]|nr:anti-phage protein KwaA [Synergistota bacterium]